MREGKLSVVKTGSRTPTPSIQIKREGKLGVVKTTLRVGEVATAAAVKMNGGGEQFNGREGEIATLLSTGLVNSELRGGGFAPRHLSRWAASLEIVES